jgi:alpha-tubulin suppressor-like RCC1 family protein
MAHAWKIVLLIAARTEWALASVGADLRGTGITDLPQIIDDDTRAVWHYDEGNLDFDDVSPQQTEACTAYRISAGFEFSCAILSDNRVKCWGAQTDQGNMGNGQSEKGTISKPPDDAIQGVTASESIAASGSQLALSHVCSVTGGWGGGPVKCWGSNSNGQLGYGDKVNRGTTTAQMGDNLGPVLLGSSFVASTVVVGSEHSCALSTAGAVKCWGNNGAGQLGTGDGASRGDLPGNMGENLPAVKGLSGKVVEICAGREQSRTHGQWASEMLGS